MERFGLSRIFVFLSLCMLVAVVSCKKPEKSEPEEQLSWEELFLFDHMQGGERFLFNKSSELEDPGIYEFGKYGPHNLFDNDPATCWAEGVSGDGIGEFVYFEITKGARRIEIANGYGKSRDLFSKNNRVKKLKASLYVGIHRQGDATEVGLYFESVKFDTEVGLSLDDTPEEQSLPFPFDWSKIRALKKKAEDDYMERFSAELEKQKIEKKDLEVICILWLEIEDVYKGSKYDDCCISDISVR